MADPLERLALELLGLPSKSRAVLASKLIASLDGEAEEDCEGLWLAEAQRRLEEVRLGKVAPRDAEDVLREARSLLS